MVLAGGRGTRWGGRDKAALRWQSRPLLDHVVDHLDADEVVVVGDERPVEVRGPRVARVRWVREEPAYAGPAAAVLAGLGALLPPSESGVPLPARNPRLVAVTAVDMPYLDADTWARLFAAATPASSGGTHDDGAVLVSGERRHLALVVDAARVLELRAGEDPEGRSMRWLLDGLDLAPLASQGREHHDLDTPADLR